MIIIKHRFYLAALSVLFGAGKCADYAAYDSRERCSIDAVKIK
jgi:hypothetical protein